MHPHYDRLIELTSKSYILIQVSELLGWDQLVMMPPGAASHRAKEMGVLSETIHALMTDEEIGMLLEKVKNEQLNEDEQANVREIGIDYYNAKAVPSSLVLAMAEHASASNHAWEEARKKNDFAIWAPYLKKTIELQRKKAEWIAPRKNPYEVLFNVYEPDLSLHQMEKYLRQMRDALVPLLQRIKERPQIDDSILFEKIDEEKLFACSRKIAGMMGYDFTKGRLDKSTHPFSAAFGRITTRLDPRWTDTISPTMHEFGHALYEHNVPEEHFGTPLGQASTLGVHESQSRFWENHIGASLEFWTLVAPVLKGIGIQASPEQVCRAMNKVEPGLVRVTADELTYTLHIIIRFEIEMLLINGELDVEDLPAVWNEKYLSYLGVTPPNDTLGCMQDVHWNDSFGYFPTYSLGNMIAAQLYETMREDLPDIDDLVLRGDLAPVRQWLAEKVHHQGRKYPMPILVERATGQPLSADAYITYLTTKFSVLYGFSV